jgi:hypothetical protein
MTATDEAGMFRSYLASNASFTVLRELEASNLVVPVVGDFGGPKAIRSIGTYLKARGATVGAFYLSNVEQYLYQDGKWPAFCRNVATLPLDGASTFIRSTSGRGTGFGVGFVSSLGAIAAETRSCPSSRPATAGRPPDRGRYTKSLCQFCVPRRGRARACVSPAQVARRGAANIRSASSHANRWRTPCFLGTALRRTDAIWTHRVCHH